MKIVGLKNLFFFSTAFSSLNSVQRFFSCPEKSEKLAKDHWISRSKWCVLSVCKNTDQYMKEIGAARDFLWCAENLNLCKAFSSEPKAHGTASA